MHTPIARVRGVVEPWCKACAIDAPSRCTIKAADSNGDGTLDRDEVEAAFKKSDALQISDESLLPILKDILDKNGGRASFEQFKEIAWKASVKSAVPSQSPLRAPPPEVQDRASHFVRSDSGNWKA